MNRSTLLGLSLFAAAACSGTDSRGDGAIAAEAAATTMQDANSPTARTIPPIDAEAPESFQTATFALG